MILIDITGPIPGLKKENQIPTAALIKPNRTAINIFMLLFTPLKIVDYFSLYKKLISLVRSIVELFLSKEKWIFCRKSTRQVFQSKGQNRSQIH